MMLKVENYIKRAPVAFVTLVLCTLMLSNMDVQAMWTQQILEHVDREFDQADNKFAVISRPMYKHYRPQEDNIDVEKLYTIPTKDHNGSQISSPISARTHALALAICAGDEERVKKYLSVVKEPNDIALLVGGWRQWYNMAHLAVDPVWPKVCQADLLPRLRIVGLVAKAGFNLDYYGDESSTYTYYRNPPLVGSYSHGGYGINWQDTEALRARLMLYGANPTRGGTSFPAMDEESITTYANLAFQQIVDENLEDLTPHDSVKTELKKLKDEKLKSISKEFQETLLNPLQESYQEKLQNISKDLQRIVKL